MDEVLSIFEATSIQAVIQNTTDGVTVTGYFPCDQPPTLGFGIPSQSNASTAEKTDSSLVSHQSTIFNIAADQWIAADNGNNNCTAILSGMTVASYPTLWVVGQRMCLHSISMLSLISSSSILPRPIYRSQCCKCYRGFGHC